MAERKVWCLGSRENALCEVLSVPNTVANSSFQDYIMPLLMEPRHHPVYIVRYCCSGFLEKAVALSIEVSVAPAVWGDVAATFSVIFQFKKSSMKTHTLHKNLGSAV